MYTSSVLRPKVYLYNQLWRTITGWVWENPEGLYVCVKGGNTAFHDGHVAAYSCGTITDNTVSPGGRNPLAFARVHLTSGTVRGGDSGGPIVSGNTAKGILITELGATLATQ